MGEAAEPMAESSQLFNFFLSEIDAEVRAGFPRLSRIPDSFVVARLPYYESLNDDERQAFRDCCAHYAHAC
jgi:hypothetical protein